MERIGEAATIEFQRDEPGLLKTQYLENEHKFVFSESWLSRLLRVVVFAEENDAMFENERKSETIAVPQTLPFSITAEQIEDLFAQASASQGNIEHDINTIFSHHI